MRVVDHSGGEVSGVLAEPAAPIEEREIDALKAVRLFAQCGSLAQVASELDIPIYPLKKLSRTEFWLRELAELQRAEAALLNVTLTQMLDRTLAEMGDRLDKGDFVYVGGLLKRTPLSAATLARVADCVFEKQRLIRELPTSIVEVENSKLANLASRLRALGAKDITLLDLPAEPIPPVQLPQQEIAFRTGDRA